MTAYGVPRLESAKEILPQINVRGYRISGKDTVIFYHIGPKNLEEIEVGGRRYQQKRTLSLSSAKKTRQLSDMILGTWYRGYNDFIAEDMLEYVYNNKAAKEAAERARKRACEAIQSLPEWDACLRRLRAQARDIISGAFKDVRQDRRREAAKKAIKEAARSCVTRYYINFEDVVKMAEEAVLELQVEDVMQG